MHAKASRVVVISIALLSVWFLGCMNPTSGGGSGNDSTESGTDRPDSLTAALAFMERFPRSVGNDLLNTTSSSSISTAGVTTVNGSETIESTRLPADILYDEIGALLDLYAWLDREESIPATGTTADLGTGSVANFRDGTTLGNRLANALEPLIGTNSFGLGNAKTVSTSSGYNVYITFDEDISANTTLRYRYFIVETSDGEIASVTYHGRAETDDQLPKGDDTNTSINGPFPTETYGKVTWSTDGTPTFHFARSYDRDKDGVFFEPTDPGSFLQTAIGTNEVRMVLATREKGIAYYTTSGQTQFASMYASSSGGAYLAGYFEPDVAGSFDTGGFEFLYLFDSNGGYLGQGETYSGTTDTSAVPTAFSNWATRYVAFASSTLSFSPTYSGKILLWDDNNTVASTSYSDDSYWIDMDASGDITTGDVDVQIGGGSTDATTVARTREPTEYFTNGLPVVDLTNSAFSTYFTWSSETEVEAWIDEAGSYLSSSPIGIGTTIDADEGDIEAFIQGIVDMVPVFPAVETFPVAP